MRPRLGLRLWALMLLIAVAAIVFLVMRERTDLAARYRVWIAHREIRAQLERPIPMRFPQGVSLSSMLRHLESATGTRARPRGLLIWVDPVGLQEAEQTMSARMEIDAQGIPLRRTLRAALEQLGLSYYLKDGLLIITCKGSEDE
jgi:hypothetical protein